MKIINQPLSLSRINSFIRCKKKFMLEQFQHTTREQKNDGTIGDFWHQEKKELEKLYVGQLKGKVVDCEFSYNKTKQAVDSVRTGVLVNPVFKYLEIRFSFSSVEIKNKKIKIFDFKSATRLKRKALITIACKIYLLKQLGYTVDQTHSILINTKFLYKHAGNYRGVFKYTDISEQIADTLGEAATIFSEARTTLARGIIPAIEVGKQCHRPIPCRHLHYCHTDKKTVKPEKPTLIDKQSFRNELKKHPMPFYYFDLEAVSFMKPKWLGTHPTAKIPFQFSCHKEEENGNIIHYEFVDTSGNNPIESFAKKLVETVTLPGTILVYDVSLEKACLQMCMKECPQYAEKLSRIISCMVDLLPLVKNYYYHTGMNNSFRLKTLAPTISPQLSYENLDAVHDGMEVQNAYLQCLLQDSSNNQVLIKEMLEYCKRDTEVLLALKQKIHED